MVIQVTKIGQNQTMFKKKNAGKSGEKERTSCDVPKRKKERRSSLFVFRMKCGSLKALKNWKHCFQWPDCLAVVTHVIWRNARREEEKITFDLSNVGGHQKDHTDTKVSKSIEFALIAPRFYFISLVFSQLCSSRGCTEKSQTPGLLAVRCASFLMYELSFRMNLSQWKETVENCTAQFVYRWRRMDWENLE